MEYKINFRIDGNKPPFTVTLHENSQSNPAVLSKTVTDTTLQSFNNTTEYTISPYKKYCIKAVDSISNNVQVCDIKFEISDLLVLVNQTNINVVYANIDENILNNKTYNIPVGENVTLTALSLGNTVFTKWETIPSNIISNLTNNPINFSMPSTNFSIKPLKEIALSKLTIVTDGTNVNVKYLDVDETISTNKTYNIPIGTNIDLRAIIESNMFNKWITTPENIIIDLDHNPINFNMPQANFSITPTKVTSIFTIDTRLGSGSSFNLPLRQGYNYDMLVDWGDGQTSEITSWNDAKKNHTYSTGGVYTITIRGLCETWYFNNTGDKSKLISIEYLNGRILTSLENAFYGCNNLTVVNGDFFGGPQLTNMSGTFNSCTSLKSITGSWSVGYVTNMSRMFKNCPVFGKDVILKLPLWHVGSVTNMEEMFTGTPLGSNADDINQTINYSNILVGWNGGSSVQRDVRLDAPLCKYWPEAVAARNRLISTFNWDINDAGPI